MYPLDDPPRPSRPKAGLGLVMMMMMMIIIMMMMTRVRVSLQTAPPLAVGQPSHTVTSLTDTQTIRLYHHDHHDGDDDDDDDDEHVKNLNKSS